MNGNRLYSLPAPQDMRGGGGPGNLPATLPVVERPRVPQPAAAGGHSAGRRREALPPDPVRPAGERRGHTEETRSGLGEGLGEFFSSCFSFFLFIVLNRFGASDLGK